MHCVPFLALFALLPVTIVAQGIVRSVPSGYATIDAAIAASSPGDTVEVAPGTYPAFDCGIGVTIRAVTPGTVDVQLYTGLIGNVPLNMTLAAQPSETVHCVGLQFLFPSVGGSAFPVLELDARIVVEDCTFAEGAGVVRVPSGAIVHMQSVIGNGPQVQVHGKLTLTQCALRAPVALGLTWAALSVTGSAHAAASSFVGGGSSFFSAQPAITSGPQARIELTDCSIERNAFATGLTCAIAGSGSLRLVRCTSNTPNCLPAQAASGLAVERTGPLQLGAPWGVTYRDQPMQIVGIHAGSEIGDIALPIFVQNWTAPLGASFPVGFAVTGAQGHASFVWTLPTSAILIGTPLWLHGFSGLTLQLQVSPPVGGLLR